MVDNVKNLENKSNQRDPLIVFSLKDFDINQGQTFKDWEENELLALAITRLRAISNLTVGQTLQQQIIKNYPKVPFPPDSEFRHPQHVPNDVVWCSMHVQGKECIIGYMVENIFYIVFLDKNHEFWKTKKR